MISRIALAFALGLAPALGLAGQSVRVIDGDTLHWQGQRIRLSGIDAPETGQTCRDSTGRRWACGQESKLALKRMIDDRGAKGRLRCEVEGADRYGRQVATCYIGPRSINRAQVLEGHAWDWPKYSKGTYRDAEQRARASRRGIWADPDPVPPWQWRHRSGGR